MTKQYSRKDKQKQTKSLEPTKHIKTGFTALQKTLALIGSILSIIVASITINNALNANKPKPTTNEVNTPIIQQNQGNAVYNQDTNISTPESITSSDSQEEAIIPTNSSESSTISSVELQTETSQTVATTTEASETSQ